MNIKKIKSITMIMCASALILSGCGNSMFNKAMEQGKLSIAAMEYEKAKASFRLALQEKEDDEVKGILEQVDNMLAGLKAKESYDIEEAIKYFGRVTEEGGAFAPMAEQATQIGQELQKVQDKINYYQQQISEAESMLNEKKYAEGKKFLAQLIEETKDQKEFTAPNQRAQEVLEQIHKEVSKIEAQRKEEIRKQEEEVARQAEIEKQKRMISDSELIDILTQGAYRLDILTDSWRTPFNPQFNSYEKVENHLSPYFSKDSIKTLVNLYMTEENGVLYGTVGDGSFSLYEDPRIIERMESKDTIHIKVSYYLLGMYDHTSDITYIYENSKWVIDSELEAASG